MLLITNYIPFPREGFKRVVEWFILFLLLSNKISPPSVWGPPLYGVSVVQQSEVLLKKIV